MGCKIFGHSRSLFSLLVLSHVKRHFAWDRYVISGIEQTAISFWNLLFCA